MMRIYIIVLAVLCSVQTSYAQQSEDVKKGEKIIALLKNHDFNAVSAFINSSSKNKVTTKVLSQMTSAVESYDWAYFSGRVSLSPYNGLINKGYAVVSTGTVFRIVMIFKDHLVSEIFIEPLLNSMKAYNEPDYRDTNKFIEKQLVIQSGIFMLGATYTVPAGIKHFPVVVFIHGSGSNNRDEALAALKPFRDISYGLAAHGIASLRYDKRNRIYGKAGVLPGTYNTIAQETTDDAAEAIKMASELPGVNPKQIFVLGHSQGGMMLPRILLENKVVAGGIFMAAPSILLYKSYEQIYRSPIAMHEATRLAALHDIEIIKHVDTVKDDQEMLSGQPAGFWKDINRYDQLKEVKRVEVPLLFLQGERDYQVRPADIGDWKKTLDNRKVSTFKIYPKINHYFSEGEGVANSVEYNKAANVPPYIIIDISNWILKQTSCCKRNKIIKRINKNDFHYEKP